MIPGTPPAAKLAVGKAAQRLAHHYQLFQKTLINPLSGTRSTGAWFWTSAESKLSLSKYGVICM